MNNPRPPAITLSEALTEDDFLETDETPDEISFTKFITGKTVHTGGFVELPDRIALALVLTSGETIFITTDPDTGGLMVGHGEVMTGTVQ